jgi:translation initiation factor IF-2
MPIRLINASKDLNVGINRLVEFLHKKGIEVEANPNAKITDEQYDVLLAEFDKDKKIRKDATENQSLGKRHRKDEKRTIALEGYELPEEQRKKKKSEQEAIKAAVPKEMKPHVNVVGSIDLNNLNKK